jgi:signal transduction histidine kinase
LQRQFQGREINDVFKVGARAILELGAELISSDIIAFYELAKNAFDAGSSIGAEIRFEVVLRRNEYLELRRRAERELIELDTLKEQIERALDPGAPAEQLSAFRERIHRVRRLPALREALDEAYASENRIVISDEGSGMSRQDLLDNYLVIGTASRKRAIDAALAGRHTGSDRPPFLGEKGIGRLSAMRLGETLLVETARREDRRFNLLEIDWSAFDDLDAMIDDIEVAPTSGGTKPQTDWSGTRLVIGRLSSDWTLDRVRQMADDDFARLTDPFSSTKRRPRIALFWNGERVPIARMDRHLLAHAHASVKGRYHDQGGEPALECEFEAINLGFEHPREVETRRFAFDDLLGSISGTSGDIPPSALSDLGNFRFEAYWFNRRLLTGIDGIGDREEVRKLQRRWAGILLFRDGFRVLPYGEDEDDWLALDRRALATSGYLLNKNQFVGRVNISRLGNPGLIDQTNREGLRVGAEQQAFVGLLQLAIQNQLRDFLLDVEKRHKDQPIDISKAKDDVAALERRTRTALDRIRKLVPAQASKTVDDLQHSFFEIKEFFEQAKQRVAEIEKENRQMVQMAGVGLLVEVVAHELARSTENALSALEALRGHDVPEQVSGLLEALRAEMRSVNKRIRVLDPLSVSGRQRREVFDLGVLVEDILSGHAAQFKRHRIDTDVEGTDRGIRIRAVKGMIVQIIENLISNSLYWLEVRRERDHSFKPRISIRIDTEPLLVFYEDNGVGIAKENRENVFRAFFSLKEKTKRRGLGLFIARECAAYHGGTLTLDEHPNPKTGRLHRFVLELPDEVVVP